MEREDLEIMKPETGIRALWLLYRRGQWGALEDFGLERAVAEPALEKFERSNVINKRLTIKQCNRLEQVVPGAREVAREMQHAYALKRYTEDLDRKVKNSVGIPGKNKRHSRSRRVRSKQSSGY